MAMCHNIDTYDTYNADFMNADLSHYLDPAEDIDYNFAGRYPENYLIRPRPNRPARLARRRRQRPSSTTPNAQAMNPTTAIPSSSPTGYNATASPASKSNSPDKNPDGNYDRIVRIVQIGIKNNAMVVVYRLQLHRPTS